MSFIFDALRKSENERQRGAVPDLASVPLAVPEQRTPRWAVALMASLGLCVAVFAGAWWQAERSAVVPAPLAARTPPIAATQTPAPAVAADQPRAAEPVAAGVAAATETLPAAPRVTQAHAEPPEPRPAEVTRPPPVRALALPGLAQIRAAGIEVPTLQLQLHSYSDSAASRFVFINGARYREGEQLEAGPRLVRITPEGAVLSQQNREFLLTVD